MAEVTCCVQMAIKLWQVIEVHSKSFGASYMMSTKFPKMSPLIYHYWFIADHYIYFWDIVSFKVMEVNDYLHSICAKLDDPLFEMELTLYTMPQSNYCVQETLQKLRGKVPYFPPWFSWLSLLDFPDCLHKGYQVAFFNECCFLLQHIFSDC